MTEEKEIVTTRKYTVGDIRKALNLDHKATMKFVSLSHTAPITGPKSITSFTAPDNHEVLTVVMREPYVEKK
jgi:hypothetical protein